MLDHVRNRKKNILLFIISFLSIIIVTTSYFFMNSQISSDFYQIPFFQEDILPISCVNECYGKVTCHTFENVNILDIPLQITDSDQTYKGADALKVYLEC